jgi:hypothetical protein
MKKVKWGLLIIPVALLIALIVILAQLKKGSSSGSGSRSGSSGSSGGSSGSKESKMDKSQLQALIKEANGWGRWGEERTTPPTEEFKNFLGVYLGNDPRSDIPKTIMTIPEFAQLVKQTIGTDTAEKRALVRSIVAIAIREQAKEGKLAFPDNNPFGFNAFKGGWQTIDIKHFSNGIFLAKDRQGWKWFLGFPSLQNAIKAMEVALRYKKFHTIQSPEDFVRLYVRRWWRPSDDESELQKIIQKEKRNLVAVWKMATNHVG